MSAFYIIEGTWGVSFKYGDANQVEMNQNNTFFVVTSS